ncbi:HAD superfamily hydrolase (TIGR01509 family) [Luteibacter rhizovicinus]|uniref:HAD superfamily hydrolase (TIGR01509 family) n=1 Tax=Luteibacter rhizovicinus TaxID=242606 RepID=A0A4R3YP87_9GAMM|nr:HAD family phosphatase [Luteibacter rhizovicinus]TCV94547.1 HAD superfamily hydrolase (TIGR01509 family) [Luteibacter rhizovicinus]
MVLFPATPMAVFFDLDGVLFDTEILYRDALRETATAAEIDVPLSLCDRMVGLHAQAARMLLREHVGNDIDLDELWSAAAGCIRRKLETELRVKAGAIELLDTLDEFGIPRAVVTSSSHMVATHHLEASGLRDRFDAVVASGDCERTKPYPDPYLLAARILNKPPLCCLALEDSHLGVRSSVAAGVPTIMVPDLLPANAEMRRMAIHVANDLHEVNKRLREACIIAHS